MPIKRPRGRRALTAHASSLYDALEALHPDAHCELDFTTPLQLLVATILSAQCTDVRVNQVTPALFARYPDARALANANVEDVEALVRPTGFFRNKARNIVLMAQALVRDHGGEVPGEMSQLVALPGVGRKTANVILSNAFGRHEGVTVDTHVGRLAARLGLTRETDPVQIEAALMPLVPQERWGQLSHLLIFHGRRVCESQRPKCGACALVELCPSAHRPAGPVPKSTTKAATKPARQTVKQPAQVTAAVAVAPTSAPVRIAAPATRRSRRAS